MYFDIFVNLFFMTSEKDTYKTIEIAESLGAKVISQKFLGHIEQKNFAISQCSNQYILSLDPVHILDILFHQSIRYQYILQVYLCT